MTFKEKLRIVGIVILAFGIICIPAGYLGNPKMGLTFFSYITDLDLKLKSGLALVLIGVIITILSYVLPDKD